jgi:hypothetical protein
VQLTRLCLDEQAKVLRPREAEEGLAGPQGPRSLGCTNRERPLGDLHACRQRSLNEYLCIVLRYHLDLRRPGAA